MQNKRLKLYYKPAPTCYEPVSVGEAYAYYGKGDLTLYEVKGLDPKEWLTEEYAGTATTVFYDKDITLPTLREMNPTKVFICINEEITVCISTIEDKKLIDTLVDLFENGEEAEYPLLGSNAVYQLKFYGEELYPHIYYNITYADFPEGKFLYERNSRRCVEIGSLLDEYIG